MLSAWSRTRPLRGRLPDGTLPAAAMTLPLALCIANSTTTAAWVPGSQAVGGVTMVAAVTMGILAVIRPVPWPPALGAGLLAAPGAGYLAASGAIQHAHPGPAGDPLAVLATWSSHLLSGETAADVSFFLWVLCSLFWVVGGWLSWCVLRWRQPLLGLVPGAAAFATTVLNFPADQNGYTFVFLGLTLGLLLWTTYLRSLESASRRRVKLSSDARWDFWETGVAVMVGVIILGIFLPPLSRSDSTVDIENGSFRGWAELQQRLNHPVAFGRGASSGTSIGFSADVPLGGPIHKTGGIVMTYTIEGTYGGPRYFRGLNMVRTANGRGGPEWRYGDRTAATQPLPKDSGLAYAETYDAQGTGAFKIQMLKPPEGAADVLFYPGSVTRIDRPAVARSAAPAADRLLTVDRLSGAGRQGGAGTYKVNVAYPNPTEDQLLQAGTDYPAWVVPYTNFSNLSNPQAVGTVAAPLSGNNYRSRATLQRVRDLALKVTEGDATPYAKAQSIETYLRSNYTYTLSPPPPPADLDPIEYFLFTSKAGYCEYFATAMGDMLRSLGIPTRLVNGYGPGTYEERLGRYVVRESDAHTWVEAYFPRYGWVPYEPTADGTYFPIARASLSTACARDSTACDPNAVPDTSGAQTAPKPIKGELDPGDAGGLGNRGFHFPVPANGIAGLAAILLLLAAGAGLAISRYLRPGSVGGVWRRTALLARLAGVAGLPGETPLEFGSRLGREIPEAAAPAGALADRFTVAAYAPREVAVTSREAVLEAWEQLRPLLLRRVQGRLRFAT